MLHIRRMRDEDILFAIRLSNQENWGVTRRDLERILQLNPRDSFVATDGSTRVGLLTTTSYGKILAWIGNVIVDRHRRGKGIGHSLVEAAIEHLHRERVRHIALYCFDENVRFYRSFGFLRNAPFVRLVRKPTPLTAKHAQPERNQSNPPRALYSADENAFGADRSRLIRLVLESRLGWYVGLKSPDSSGSYLLVKTYKDSYEFGPWVCVAPMGEQPAQMLQMALCRTARKTIEASCLRNNAKAFRLLRRNGFEVVRHGYRMYLDRISELGNDDSSYLLGFLDKG